MNVLVNLSDQLTQYEFHEALPVMAKSLHNLRVSLGVEKLWALHNIKLAGSEYLCFSHIKQKVLTNKLRSSKALKVFKRYIAKQDALSVRNSFSYWHSKV